MQPVVVIIGLTAGMVVVSLLASCVAIGLALHAKIAVEAMQKSTHSIQYVPVDKAWESQEKELNKAAHLGKMAGPSLEDIEPLPNGYDNIE